MKTIKDIRCPNCGTNEKLIIYLESRALLKMRILNGSLDTKDTIFLQPKLEGSEVTIFDSCDEVSSATRIVFYEDEAITQIDCPICRKVFDIDRD
jgi:predicted RNA-binding Zn-ribbon protein involved in translation (DUF1610 family)